MVKKISSKKKKKAKTKVVKKTAKIKAKKNKVAKKAPKKTKPKKATVKKKATKKSPAKTGKAKQLENKSHKLLVKGKERGFVTYDEILKEFPTIEDDIMFLDELYAKLHTAGVDILEGGGILDLGEDDAPPKKNLYGGKSDSSYDSIQMYLKEIGQYPLILASQEKELAKRIEAGDDEAQMKDLEYIEAMEYGMPPAFGFGTSERMFAILCGVSVREAQIFPLMRPRD